MADRYRLPEALGGGECELMSTIDGYRVHAVIAVTGLPDGPARVPLDWLTKLETLPPEPPLWAVVVDKHERAWQHVNDGRGDWTCTVADLGADWEELQEHAPLTRLVPDPAVGVELPWTHTDTDIFGRKVTVTVTRLGGGPSVSVRVDGREYGAYVNASAMAGALLAAEAGAP